MNVFAEILWGFIKRAFRITGRIGQGWGTLIFLLSLLSGNFAQHARNPFPYPESLIRQSVKEVLGVNEIPRWKHIFLPAHLKADLEKKLKVRRVLPDSLSIGELTVQNARYFVILDEAPSKTERFLYALYFTETGAIRDVDVLIYRENYGHEIDYPAFRKQFAGKEKADQIVFGRSIQNITGATISARSITYAVRDWLTVFSALRNQKLLTGE